MINDVFISVVIPTHNEAGYIEASVKQFINHGRRDHFEVIVVDGGSHDGTAELAAKAGAVVITNAPKNRASQMNMGAAQTTHPILYFVHADVVVPETFYSDIAEALSEGEEAGCYRSGFEYYPGLMRINAFVTRFKWLTARGGDQTLFITKPIFQELKGFDERYTIMEDYDIIKRLWAAGKKFTILPNEVTISLRKYKNNSWLRVQYANATAMIMFSRGYSADQIKTKYQKLINPA
jgi:rSAM/selenodomain-associated transferase 2